MKTLLLTVFFSFTFLNINSQCTENAGSFGNNTATQSYNISGDVSVTLNTNSTLTIDFANNFSTATGPDVRMYLLKSEGKTLTELKDIAKDSNDELTYNGALIDNIKFGLIGFSGAQSYTETIPNSKDISEYDTIFFFCLEFGAFWDVGSFNAFTSNNCSVLDIDTFAVNQISIYPNPAKNQIQVSNIDAVSAEIRIFNVLGKQVFHQSKITEKGIDISTFNKGIYLVRIDVDGKSKTQKLVIQ